MSEQPPQSSEHIQNLVRLASARIAASDASKVFLDEVARNALLVFGQAIAEGEPLSTTVRQSGSGDITVIAEAWSAEAIWLDGQPNVAEIGRVVERELATAIALGRPLVWLPVFLGLRDFVRDLIADPRGAGVEATAAACFLAAILIAVQAKGEER